MPEKELDNLRDQINKLDNQMLDILDQRSYIVTEIGKIKDKTKGVVDENREQTVLDRLVNLSKGKYSKDIIIRIWRELFEASSRLQVDNKSSIITKRSIEKIEVYEGGKSKIDGQTDVIKLSSNENPFGPSKQIAGVISTDTLNRYPEISGNTLRDEIAKFFNLKSNQIILGCGSDETLLFAALSFCQSGDEIIHAEHGFEMYPIIAKVVGAVSKLAKEDNYKINVQSICDQLTPATKLIYIANPNNPTGSYLSKKEIRDLMTKIPKNIILVLDGAYTEYVERDDYDDDFLLVKEFENIILTRTFSKAYGLAGIRLGWCYTSPKVASILSRVKGPFNTNTLAQQMAITAIQDQKHVKMVVKENKKNKKWFEEELKKIGFTVISTYANFSFIESTDLIAATIAETLLKNGIIIRQLHSYNLPHCLRISIGTMEDMKKIIKILKGIL
jgi:histidinol-phosphate aminotransferase